MDTDDLRDSGDDEDLADQDERDEEAEDPPEDNTKKETGSSSSENRPENLASTSRKSSKRSRIKSRVETPNIRVDTPNPAVPAIPVPPKRTWRSANAFVNFVQDFKKDYPDMIMGRNIFQICSERWKSMSDEQKQPYIVAANSVKRLKQRKVGDNGEPQTKKPVNRVSKRKAETKRKETNQKRSKVINRDAKSNTDTDTATNT